MLLMLPFVRRILMVLVLLLAVGAAAFLASRPDLDAARSDVEDHWLRVAVALDERYELAGRALEAVRAVGDVGGGPDVAGELDAALRRWRDLGEATSDPAAAIPVAGRVEGLVTRLHANVAATRALREDPDVVEAMGALEGAAPVADAVALDRAVRRYQEVRESFPARLLAGPLGFGAIPTFELAPVPGEGPEEAALNPST